MQHPRDLLLGAQARTGVLPVCDQYTIQGDLFSQAVRDEADVAVPLETALGNMAVLDAIAKAGASGRWENV